MVSESKKVRGDITKEYVARCGGCGITQPLLSATKNTAKSYARELGWSLTHDRGWICQVCTHLNRRGK